MVTRTTLLAVCTSAMLAAPAAAQIPASSVTPDATMTLSPAPASPDRARIVVPRVEWPGGESRETAPGFGRIFGDLGASFRRLPSRENALVLGIGAGLAGLSVPSDRRVSDSFHGVHSAEGAFKPGAVLGNFYVQLGAGFGAYAVGRATGSTKTAVVGADLVRAQIVSQGTTQALKYVAGRTRPNGEAKSFPSGHTSSAFATATVLQRHYGWKVGIPAYAFAGYIGASRIQSRKHFLSDVAFGAALGMAAGRAVTFGVGQTTFAVAPQVVPGGIGISITKIKK